MSTVLCGSCVREAAAACEGRSYAMQADGSCQCCASSAVQWLSLLAGLYAMRWVIKTSIRAALSLDGADELSRATAAVSKIGVNYM